MMRQDFVNYFNDSYHQSAAYKKKLADAEKQELARQSLCRGENTLEARAYAAFLLAVEKDATVPNGKFIAPSDAEIEREFPVFAGTV